MKRPLGCHGTMPVSSSEVSRLATHATFAKTFLQKVIGVHCNWTASRLSEHRLNWCRHWLKRATELEPAERLAAAARSPTTRDKRILLTKEILESIDYKDMGVLKLLEDGSPLAGEVEASPLWEAMAKPCLCTVQQLEANSVKRNQMVMSLTGSSGSRELDEKLLEETREELRLGWADGPWGLDTLEPGATVSKRFPLKQGNKVRMIDDYTVSGVNESCSVSSKVDLHMVDTFAAVVKVFFESRTAAEKPTELVAKTYDLKSAYRQVPIRSDHLKFAYFCLFNHEVQQTQIYRMKTLPFGATQSVYSFLRLAKALHAIATRGLFLLTTNFYDDYVLASEPELAESSRHAMEMVFLLTGWTFAREGKKATEFGDLRKALGVTFDLSHSASCILEIWNTRSRVSEICDILKGVCQSRTLARHDALKLRGRLGFADGFLHGRLGALVLKKLVDHAYSGSSRVDEDLACGLEYMIEWLMHGKPKRVGLSQLKEWHVYSDASYEPDRKTGGLGGVLFDDSGKCVSWFGLQLDEETCSLFGALKKETIIYELEMLAGILAMALWTERMANSFQILFLDNDSVRYALIKGSATGDVACRLMHLHLKLEASQNLNTWFARVPTEANIADLPSRACAHVLLPDDLCCSLSAELLLNESVLEHFPASLQMSGGEVADLPQCRK